MQAKKAAGKKRKEITEGRASLSTPSLLLHVERMERERLVREKEGRGERRRWQLPHLVPPHQKKKKRKKKRGTGGIALSFVLSPEKRKRKKMEGEKEMVL